MLPFIISFLSHTKNFWRVLLSLSFWAWNKSIDSFLLDSMECLLCEYRLNILAELLRFGDREFYKDWWNAKTIDEVVRHVDLLSICFLSWWFYSLYYKQARTYFLRSFLFFVCALLDYISIGERGTWYISLTFTQHFFSMCLLTW